MVLVHKKFSTVKGDSVVVRGHTPTNCDRNSCLERAWLTKYRGIPEFPVDVPYLFCYLPTILAPCWRVSPQSCAVPTVSNLYLRYRPIPSQPHVYKRLTYYSEHILTCSAYVIHPTQGTTDAINRINVWQSVNIMWSLFLQSFRNWIAIVW